MSSDDPIVSFWSIRDPWEQALETDEFGGGTNDGCGPYAIENATAAYEQREPTYAGGEAIRREMIQHDGFTPGGGCFLHDIDAEIPRLHGGGHYHVPAWLGAQDSTLDPARLNHALDEHRCAAIVEVYNAEMLPHNEPGVHRHFVVIAAVAVHEHSGHHYYILNSDIAREVRHSPQPGEWITEQDLHAADLRGYVLLAPVPPPPPPPPDQPGHYTITPGDTLESIWQHLHLHHSWFMDLYKPNMHTIEEAARQHGHPDSNKGNLIFPGTVLTYEVR